MRVDLLSACDAVHATPHAAGRRSVAPLRGKVPDNTTCLRQWLALPFRPRASPQAGMSPALQLDILYILEFCYIDSHFSTQNIQGHASTRANGYRRIGLNQEVNSKQKYRGHGRERFTTVPDENAAKRR